MKLHRFAPLLLSLLIAAPAFAQTATPPGCVDSYPTATPTQTPTITPTPTPNIFVIWTLAPVASGTPGQAVAFVYEMSAGGMVNAMLLFVLLASLLVILTLMLLRRKE